METEQAQSETKKQYSKAERRQLEYKNKVEAEAQSYLDKLLINYYNFFLEVDPEGEAIKRKQRELSAKWKMTAKRLNLKVESYNLFDKNSEMILDEYKAQLVSAPPAIQAIEKIIGEGEEANFDGE